MKTYKTPMFKPHKLKTASIMAGSPFNTTDNESKGRKGGISDFNVTGNESDVDVVFE